MYIKKKKKKSKTYYYWMTNRQCIPRTQNLRVTKYTNNLVNTLGKKSSTRTSTLGSNNYPVKYVFFTQKFHIFNIFIS